MPTHLHTRAAHHAAASPSLPTYSTLLHQEARSLAVQAEEALHDPAAHEDSFLQVVDRYADVLAVLRRQCQSREALPSLARRSSRGAQRRTMRTGDHACKTNRPGRGMCEQADSSNPEIDQEQERGLFAESSLEEAIKICPLA